MIEDYSNIIYITPLILIIIDIINSYTLKKGNKNIGLNKKEYLFIFSSFITFLADSINKDKYI